MPETARSDLSAPCWSLIATDCISGQARAGLERAGAQAADAARTRFAVVQAQLEATTTALEEARTAVTNSDEARAAMARRFELLETALQRERDGAADMQHRHAAELQAAKEKAAAAVSAAAAVAVSRGGAAGVSPGDNNGFAAATPSTSGGAVRAVSDATARLQEGELVAVRKLLAASERQQQALLEQLARERALRQQAAAEAARTGSLIAEYNALHERYSACLEMLGEKEEERMVLEEQLEQLGAPGTASSPQNQRRLSLSPSYRKQ